jgi:hypothetical protein
MGGEGEDGPCLVVEGREALSGRAERISCEEKKGFIDECETRMHILVFRVCAVSCRPSRTPGLRGD